MIEQQNDYKKIILPNNDFANLDLATGVCDESFF